MASKRFYTASLTNSAQTIGNSRTSIKEMHVYNDNSTETYLQFFNTAETVTVGTTVPTFQIPIAPNHGLNLQYPRGLNEDFDIACQVAATSDSQGGTAPTNALTFYAKY